MCWPRARREHPGARHRGLFKHRRPELQGHAARAVAKFAAGGKPNHKKDLPASPWTTRTSTSPRWPTAPGRAPLKAFLERRAIPGCRSSSPTARASPTASTCSKPSPAGPRGQVRTLALAALRPAPARARQEPAVGRQRRRASPSATSPATRRASRCSSGSTPRPRPVSSPRPARTPACATRNTWNSEMVPPEVAPRRNRKRRSRKQGDARCLICPPPIWAWR